MAPKNTPKETKEAKDQVVTFNLEPTLKRKLEKIATSQDRSVAYIVRSAVEQFLSEPKAAA
jgi:predicted transcriptional regulator